MKIVKRSRKKYFLVGAGVFVLVGVMAFFAVQFFTKTGIFRVPGVVHYDESLSASELATLESIFTEGVELDKDVYISAYESLTRPVLQPGEYLVSIEVPVTDFYSTNEDIQVDDMAKLYADCYVDCGWKMISVDELDYAHKLLAINGKYYLDDFAAGAVYRVLKFDSENYTEEILPLVGGAFQKEFPEEATVLSFAQTGVTALSRGMNAKLYSVGDATYFAANIGDFLAQFDLTHTSNESSFTNYATSANICSDPRFIDTLMAIGLDIVELTGNHNQDCGDEAAADSIDMYRERGVRIVGGGKTADEAAEPLTISEKGNNITMLAYNLSTGGATYDATPGANQYYEDVAAGQIAEAKARGDSVIVDIQYYECSMYASTTEDATCDAADSAAGDQVGFFRHLIDLGADVVVGTSAHQPQTYELYGNGVIYYGLGNLFFDQVWWPGTTRSLILVHHFYKDKLLQTEIVPTVYDNSMQTKLMDTETKQWYLQRLQKVRP